jgi:hypothetical protein
MKKLLLVFALVLISKAAFAVQIPSFNVTVIRTEPTGITGIDKIQIFNKATGAQILNCDQPSCTVSVKSGTNIKIVAVDFVPQTGFLKWERTNTGTGVCVGSSNKNCEVTVSGDIAANAVFKRIEIVRLQLGEGDGKLVLKRNGTFVFECTNRAPLQCSTGFLEGDKVRIEAIAGHLSQFHNFSGQTGDATVCTGQGATFFCEFTLTNASTALGAMVVGNFILIP